MGSDDKNFIRANRQGVRNRSYGKQEAKMSQQY